MRGTGGRISFRLLTKTKGCFLNLYHFYDGLVKFKNSEFWRGFRAALLWSIVQNSTISTEF